MSGGLFLLFLALLGFAAMGVLHKVGDHVHCQPIMVTAITMAAGAATSLTKAMTAGSASKPIPWEVLAIAIPFGVFAAAALWAFQTGVKHGRISTSWLLLNLSVAIPSGLSVLLFGESISPLRAGALTLMIIALCLMWWERRSTERAQEKHGGEPCGSN